MVDDLSDRVPPWVIFHVPHDSVEIPGEVRSQFLLSDAALEHELRVMTDLHTGSLLAHGVSEAQVMRAPVSRLVVDVERFERDEEEPMSPRGMGAIYQVTHRLEPLRRALTRDEREALLCRWYRPHHLALTHAVERALAMFDRALVVDAHSFPSTPLPYELNDAAVRPEVCLGTDAFHTPPLLVAQLNHELQTRGFWTAMDTPFSGALVPSLHYQRDPRVAAVMIEVRRDLYLDESTGQPGKNFVAIRDQLRESLLAALASWGSAMDVEGERYDERS